jgi:hypothetical protein
MRSTLTEPKPRRRARATASSAAAADALEDGVGGGFDADGERGDTGVLERAQAVGIHAGGMEFDADVGQAAETVAQVVEDGNEPGPIDGGGAAADIEGGEGAALEMRGVEVDLLLDGSGVGGEQGFFVFDAVVGAVGAEVLAERHVEIEAGGDEIAGPAGFAGEHPEPPRVAGDGFLDDGFPDQLAGDHAGPVRMRWAARKSGGGGAVNARGRPSEGWTIFRICAWSICRGIDKSAGRLWRARP